MYITHMSTPNSCQNCQHINLNRTNLSLLQTLIQCQDVLMHFFRFMNVIHNQFEETAAVHTLYRKMAL